MASAEVVNLESYRKGQDRNGDSGSDPRVLPEWMDRERFCRGQQFFVNHCAAILFSLHCSLVVGFSVKNLLEPLVFTNRSCTANKALVRYVETFVHLFLWHTEDVWDVNSLGHQSVMKVRRMHHHVRTAMEKREGGATKRVSQYDMSVVQAGFMAVAVMYPEHFGIKTTVEELEDYIFFWRGIGYLLGIEDEYNVCTRVNYAETYALCKEIEEKEVLHGLLNPPPAFEHMAQAYIDGVNIPPQFNFNSLEAIIAFSMEVTGHTWCKRESLSLADRTRIACYKFHLWCIRWVPGFERLVNWGVVVGIKPAFAMVYKQLGH